MFPRIRADRPVQVRRDKGALKRAVSQEKVTIVKG